MPLTPFPIPQNELVPDTHPLADPECRGCWVREAGTTGHGLWVREEEARRAWEHGQEVWWPHSRSWVLAAQKPDNEEESDSTEGEDEFEDTTDEDTEDVDVYERARRLLDIWNHGLGDFNPLGEAVDQLQHRNQLKPVAKALADCGLAEEIEKAWAQSQCMKWCGLFSKPADWDSGTLDRAKETFARIMQSNDPAHIAQAITRLSGSRRGHPEQTIFEIAPKLIAEMAEKMPEGEPKATLWRHWAYLCERTEISHPQIIRDVQELIRRSGVTGWKSAINELTRLNQPYDKARSPTLLNVLRSTQFVRPFWDSTAGDDERAWLTCAYATNRSLDRALSSEMYVWALAGELVIADRCVSSLLSIGKLFPDLFAHPIPEDTVAGLMDEQRSFFLEGHALFFHAVMKASPNNRSKFQGAFASMSVEDKRIFRTKFLSWEARSFNEKGPDKKNLRRQHRQVYNDLVVWFGMQ